MSRLANFPTTKSQPTTRQNTLDAREKGTDQQQLTVNNRCTLAFCLLLQEEKAFKGTSLGLIEKSTRTISSQNEERKTMRSDLLSKRIFFAGFLGLPWLWIVHILYWRTNEESNDQGILNPDDRT